MIDRAPETHQIQSERRHNSMKKQKINSKTNETLQQKHNLSEQCLNQQSQEQFQLKYHTMKKLKMPINRKKLTSGYWSNQQNRVYLQFLETYKESLASHQARKQNRVFCVLSEKLNKKRTPDQCRSHHIKLLRTYKYSINGLIAQLKNKLKKIIRNQKTAITPRHSTKKPKKDITQEQQDFPIQERQFFPKRQAQQQNNVSVSPQKFHQESQERPEKQPHCYTIRIVLDVDKILSYY